MKNIISRYVVWVVTSILFIVGIYIAHFHNIQGAENGVKFIIITLFVLIGLGAMDSNKAIDKLIEQGKKPNVIPYALTGPVDILIIVFLAWVGWFFTALAYMAICIIEYNTNQKLKSRLENL